MDPKNTSFKGIKSLYSTLKILTIGSLGVIGYIQADKLYLNLLDQAVHLRLNQIGVQEFTIDHRNGKTEKARLSNSDLNTVSALLFQTQYEQQKCLEKVQQISETIR